MRVGVIIRANGMRHNTISRTGTVAANAGAAEEPSFGGAAHRSLIFTAPFSQTRALSWGCAGKRPAHDTAGTQARKRRNTMKRSVKQAIAATVVGLGVTGGVVLA